MTSMITKDSNIYYLDYNRNGNPTVLLLHGLGVDGSSWGYQIPALCQADYRPIAPDIPGFGRSDFRGRRWSIREAAGEINSLLDKLFLGSVVVVGISMGGVIALQLVLDYPEKTNKLVLINTFASLRPKRFDEMAYLVSRFAIANLRGINYQSKIVAQRLFPKPEQAELRQELVDRIRLSDPRVYRAAMRSLGLFNVRKRLGTINVPTLVISGAKDTTVALKNQMELVQGIPGAKHIVVEESGHAVIADQPDHVNRHLIEFIGGSA